ncbi:Pyrophosphate--fructose 6-phosphate 1-phosphotransferase [Anaerohalosphaera lusitana]|uniref:Pyrophosphate--fructose 6-phosphate 1-phosphotransferase n=1 Tax=Anaerohalosphaera lusitana TaxID=1936003 RepID=A0A1U9NQU9_9BACT|nr:ATP-dependent 6-phosphofructokinase [Anaerohalosphaera lusitana]AQT70289.1 Pyrophosphate--fructose 6-phosphate 1-phosphotransferase [Anaerohalosphaera lusitana]
MDAASKHENHLPDLAITSLGAPSADSPLTEARFVNDEERVLVHSRLSDIEPLIKNSSAPSFEIAGPRRKIFFDPKDLTCGIVTCGGLCPGLNDVIRSVTLSLLWQYKVKRVIGFRYGYNGISSNAYEDPIELTPDTVSAIQHIGGTILGSSRGPQSPADMVDQLIANNVRILYIIGGDGTFAGGHDIANEITKRQLPISVIGIPKTIDNDIYCSEKTFGFGTAVEHARSAIHSAHTEARGAWNGVGLVKLMGRDSGFIAASATLANSDVNFCLVPEVPFELDGRDGFLARLVDRINRKRHAVVVAAEGAGRYLEKTGRKDASGNEIYPDIGFFLKERIRRHFSEQNIPVTVKYIDPSYMIRSVPANAADSQFCIQLGQNAVHAGMAGKTDMFVAYWNNHFTHVPLAAAVGRRKKLDPASELWQGVIATTD